MLSPRGFKIEYSRLQNFKEIITMFHSNRDLIEILFKTIFRDLFETSETLFQNFCIALYINRILN